ncbi:unnamed protein product [Phytophthora fragariaefolia]|uniref:Unnamed protein product n=1 Tax=Phytophthora fragariaefolia TaxID=1490495 RepID=A0A9W6XJ66_9STRA|nr:unnamed protein product [Phytophthora fragariaefolia]
MLQVLIHDSGMHRTIRLALSRDGKARQQLREAIELFTLLSLVDNKAFREAAASLMETHQPQAHDIVTPQWNIEQIIAHSRNSSVLFGAIVPPIAQLCATGEYISPTANSPRSTRSCAAVTVWITNWADPAISEFAIASARTAASTFSLYLGTKPIASQQALLNAGFLLSMLICGRCVARRKMHDMIRLQYGRLDLYMVEFDKNFIATFSAVADVSVEAHLDSFRLSLKNSTQWSWMIYALCCGDSGIVIPFVKLPYSRLTKADMQVIAAVLQTNFPQPIFWSKREPPSPEASGNYRLGVTNLIQLDLSALSFVCPDLEYLFASSFVVVVSDYNESLRRWPIQEIDLHECPDSLAL